MAKARRKDFYFVSVQLRLPNVFNVQADENPHASVGRWGGGAADGNQADSEFARQTLEKMKAAYGNEGTGKVKLCVRGYTIVPDSECSGEGKS